MSLKFTAVTDPGLRRPTNEDSYCARPDLGLFAVADGLGGHGGGQVASRTAIQAIEAFVAGAVGFEEQLRCGIEHAPRGAAGRLQAAVSVANARIALMGSGRPELAGMATTIAAALVERRPGRADARAAVVHVGDSRVYLYRSGALTRVTRDHSWVEDEVRAGRLTAAEARTHQWRSVVTRALTGAADAGAETTELALQSGDRLLICSDGIYAVLSDEQIASVLGQNLTGEALVHLANLAGGPDNMTVLIVEV